MKSFPWKNILILGAVLIGLGIALPKILRKQADNVAPVKTTYIDTIAHTRLVMSLDKDSLFNNVYALDLKNYKQAFKAENIRTARFKTIRGQHSVTFDTVKDEKKGMQIIRAQAKPFEALGVDGLMHTEPHVKLNARTIRSYNITIAPAYLDLFYNKAVKHVTKNLHTILPLKTNEVAVVTRQGPDTLIVQINIINDKHIDRIFAIANKTTGAELSAGTLPAKLRVIERKQVTP